MTVRLEKGLKMNDQDRLYARKGIGRDEMDETVDLVLMGGEGFKGLHHGVLFYSFFHDTS